MCHRYTDNTCAQKINAKTVLSGLLYWTARLLTLELKWMLGGCCSDTVTGRRGKYLEQIKQSLQASYRKSSLWLRVVSRR